jgi:hypothetical protein
MKKMNPKTPLTKEAKEEIHFLLSGASDSVEAEPTKNRGKKISYDFEDIVSVLKSGKKYVLPSVITRVNTVYELLAKLRANDKIFNRVAYFAVKGTVEKHLIKSKNNKEYSYTTAQYFLMIVQ